MDLSQRKCVPCEGGVPPLSGSELDYFMDNVDWLLEDNKIKKEFEFKDFLESMKFVNSVADLAESEGHHPDILIEWNKVSLTLWTHSISGLSENDFIMACKINEI